MKKIINHPGDLVGEMCQGMALAHPHLRWGETANVITRSQPAADKVTLISGGGSGHEPAHAGFVGAGMLDAAVCGDVFASPSQVQVYNAIRSTAGGKGTLLIVKNYSGDMMNFGLAASMAEEEGIQVDWVKVDDDIAVQDSLYTVGRRGVAGTIFVHKIAGAAAERGYPLARVKALAQRAVDGVKTIGFALTSCTVPAKGAPTFSLGEGELEYGVGIHGEPGIRREPLSSADALAGRMVSQLLEELEIKTGELQEVALLVNGLGGTPLQELYVLNRAVRAHLAEYPHIQVVFNLTGNYMTSIDMAGASISLLKLDDELRELLFDPCETPALRLDGPLPATVFQPPAVAREGDRPPCYTLETDPAQAVIVDNHLTLDNVIYLVDAMSDCIIRNEVPFCELDAHAGDGDFGMSVAKGFRRIKENWTGLCACQSLETFFHSASLIIMEHCGGASGPIWGSAFRAAALYCRGLDSLDEGQVADLLDGMVQGIQTTGRRAFGRGAVLGDKTLLDALIPCAKLWRERAGQSVAMTELFRLGAQAAVEGAQQTRNIVARMGRAGTVGERSLGHPDAGAHALGVIFTDLAQHVRQ